MLENDLVESPTVSQSTACVCLMPMKYIMKLWDVNEKERNPGQCCIIVHVY